jgi:hypothetical protein
MIRQSFKYSERRVKEGERHVGKRILRAEEALECLVREQKKSPPFYILP